MYESYSVSTSLRGWISNERTPAYESHCRTISILHVVFIAENILTRMRSGLWEIRAQKSKVETTTSSNNNKRKRKRCRINGGGHFTRRCMYRHNRDGNNTEKKYSFHFILYRGLIIFVVLYFHFYIERCRGRTCCTTTRRRAQ